jgi:hypothetical protein
MYVSYGHEMAMNEIFPQDIAHKESNSISFLWALIVAICGE